MKATFICNVDLDFISETLISSRVVWDCSLNYSGVRPHPKLNIGRRPIAKKYCEGKVKRTLKRELKELEIVKREAKSTGQSSKKSKMSKSMSFWSIHTMVME